MHIHAWTHTHKRTHTELTAFPQSSTQTWHLTLEIWIKPSWNQFLLSFINPRQSRELEQECSVLGQKAGVNIGIYYWDVKDHGLVNCRLKGGILEAPSDRPRARKRNGEKEKDFRENWGYQTLLPLTNMNLEEAVEIDNEGQRRKDLLASVALFL